MNRTPLAAPISLAPKVRVEFHVVAEINGKEKARGWKRKDAPLAQLAEQLTLNQWVPGSSPGGCTTGKTASGLWKHKPGAVLFFPPLSSIAPYLSFTPLKTTSGPTPAGFPGRACEARGPVGSSRWWWGVRNTTAHGGRAQKSAARSFETRSAFKPHEFMRPTGPPHHRLLSNCRFRRSKRQVRSNRW